MATKPDFAANLANREPIVEEDVKKPVPRKQKLVPGRIKKPGRDSELREGMSLLSGWVLDEDHRWMRHEAVDHKTTVGALLAEAVSLLRQKRDR